MVRPWAVRPTRRKSRRDIRIRADPPTMRPAPSTPTSSAWTRTPVPRPPRARRRRRRRWIQRAVVLALASLTAITALHSVLNSTMVRSRLRDRVEAALAARLGGVELGSHSEVDWSMRLSFGPVRISPEPGSPVVMEMERVRVRPRWTALLAGRLEPGLVQLRTVVLRPGTHLEGLKALARRLESKPGAPPKEGTASTVSRDAPTEAGDPGPAHRARVEPGRASARPRSVGRAGGGLGRRLGAGARARGAARRRRRGALHRALGARSAVPGRGRGGGDAPPPADRAPRPARRAAGHRRLGHRAHQRAAARGPPPRRARGRGPHRWARSSRASRLATEPVGPWRLSGAGTVDWDRGSARGSPPRRAHRLRGERLAPGQPGGCLRGHANRRASGPRRGSTSSATRTPSTPCPRSSAWGTRRRASRGCSMRGSASPGRCAIRSSGCWT